MAADRPEVRIRPGFSGAAVVFEVHVTNPTPMGLRAVRLIPEPVPKEAPLDRDVHLIPLLGSRKARTLAFRINPLPDHDVVALDISLEWEDEAGNNRGRLEVSSRPVDLTCPDLSGPRQGLDRWRAGLRGGAAIEVRLRKEAPPEAALDELEEAMEGLPGEMSATREEGQRGPKGRLRLRAEGAKGRRAGVLLDVTPDPKTGGSRVLLTVSATTEELLACFYHACLKVLAGPLPGMDVTVPSNLIEET